MRVVALYRVSTDKQERQGASLDAQQRRFRELATLNRWKIVAELRGAESASGASSDRDVLQAALRALPDADAIYVHEQSRLTRGDELEVALLMRELRERGVKIIVNGHLRDLESVDERFMLRIQSVVDRAEIERIKERCSRGRREKAQRGQWYVGNAPFGYVNPPVGDPARGTLRIVPGEAAVVRRIYREYLAGRSMRAIAEGLDRDGIRSPRGGHWPKNTIPRILDNPTYRGSLLAFRWTTQPTIATENVHEAIVSVSDWDAVKQRRERETHTGGTPAMLTGLLWLNGRKAEATHGGAKRRCQHRYGIARGPHVERRQADAIVWDGAVRMLSTPQFIGELIEAVESEQPAQRDGVEYRKTIAKLERRIDGYQQMRADGELSKADYDRKLAETRQQIAATRRAIEQVESRPADSMEQSIRAMQAVVGAGLPERDRRAVLHALAERIDATVVRSGEFTRDERGQVTGTTDSWWRLQDVKFILRVGVLGTADYSCSRLVATVLAGGERVLRFERVGAVATVAAAGRGVA